MKNIVKLLLLLVLLNSEANASVLKAVAGGSGGGSDLGPTFPVMKYGALCNGLKLTDVTTTLNSPVVSSASYNFIGADVGKYINIFGGTSITTTGNTATGTIITNLASTTGVNTGQLVIASGVPADTYVLAVLSATSVILTNPTTSSLSGTSIQFVPFINTTIISAAAGAATLNANMLGLHTGSTTLTFGTDDTAAIQAAETAAHTNGVGTVTLPAAMCVTTAPVNWDTKISMTGRGYGESGIKWISLTGMSSTNRAVLLDYNGTAGAPMDDNYFADFYVDMNAAFMTSYSFDGTAFRFVHMHKPTFTRLKVMGCPATCFGEDAGVDMLFDGNYVISPGRLNTGTGFGGAGFGLGIETTADTDLFGGETRMNSTVVNNFIINPTRYGIFFENTDSNVGPITTARAIINNNYIKVYQTTENNFGIQDNGLSNALISNNIVFGPLTTTAGVAGISVGLGSGGNQASGRNGLISNNVIVGFANGILMQDITTSPSNGYALENNYITACGNAGIEVEPTSTWNTLGVTGNTVSNCGAAGIHLSSAGGTPILNNVTLNNNILYDNGSTTATEFDKSGIALNTTITGLEMVGNYAYDDGANTQKYGIGIGTSAVVTDARVGPNHLNDNTTSPVYNAGGTFSPYYSNPGTAALTVAGGAIATDASRGDYFTVTLVASTATTMSAPSNAFDRSVITYKLIQDAVTGSGTVTWNGVFDFGASGAPTLSTAASKVDLVGFRYDATAAKWIYIGSQLGN